jgi:hypothetical protein
MGMTLTLTNVGLILVVLKVVLRVILETTMEVGAVFAIRQRRMATTTRRPTGVTTHIHEALKVIGLLETGHGCRTRTSHTNTTNPREGVFSDRQRLQG